MDTRKPKNNLSVEVKQAAVARHKAGGVTIPALAAELNVSVSTVGNWLRDGVQTGPRRGTGNKGRHSDTKIRACLHDSYGPNKIGPKAAAAKHGIGYSTVSTLKDRRPDLMPGKGSTSIVPAASTPLFDVGFGAPEKPLSTQTSNGLQLEAGGVQEAAEAAFTQSQEDRWEEMMQLIGPLAVRSRLRLIQLIGEMQL